MSRSAGGDLLITIDGPAGTGKSTVTKLLARKLGLDWLDTGAMYRAVAWALRQSGREGLTGEPLISYLRGLDLVVRGVGAGQQVLVDGKDITREIRTPEIGQLASAVSMRPEVRAVLSEKQRALGEKGRMIAEGRDMGTVVFPQADFKFYLDASPEVRAERRYRELTQAGYALTREEVRRAMALRDEQDQKRAIAPLRPAPEAWIIDTTSLTLEEVLNRILQIIDSKGGEGPGNS